MIECGLMSKRNVLSVEITPDAANALTALEHRSNWARKEIVARLLDWVATQDTEVRDIALGLIPVSLAEPARKIAIENLKPQELRRVVDGVVSVVADEVVPRSRRKEPPKGKPPAKGKSRGRYKVVEVNDEPPEAS